MKITKIAVLTTILASASSFALPASTDALIRALLSSKEFAEVTKAEKQPLQAVEITRAGAKDDAVQSLCKTAVTSKSAAVLKVEYIYGKGPGNSAAVYSSSQYFATDGDPSDLTYCDGE